MNFSNITRTGTALVAGAALFAAVSSGADAIPDTFNVSTTISASCSITDSGPADLTPTYSPSSDSGVGSASALNTNCSGTSPTVTFVDSGDSGDNIFVMSSGGNYLYFQISNNTSCSGGVGDNPISENTAIPLTTGVASFNICAAVITGGQNTGAVAGSYSDTVTYTIAP